MRMSRSKFSVLLLSIFFVGALFLFGNAIQAEAKVDWKLKKGKYVVALSNSYYGNTWRKQMVDNFTEAAESAKKQGLISDYIVQNGDNTVNSQISQINSFILQGVDAIVIDPASSTALNSVLKKAMKAGIKVITFDCSVTLDSVYAVDFDFVTFGYDSVVEMAKLVGEKAKVIIIRGLAGTSADEEMYQGNLKALKNYPNMEVLATVHGDFSATKTQEALLQVLPSLKKVDGVITQCGGDAYGAAQAFEQIGSLGRPVIIGDNSAEFLKWWSEVGKKDGEYKTYSRGTCPSVSSAAFWASLYILNGYDVPKKMICDYYTVYEKELGKYSNMEPGTIISPTYAPEYVLDSIIEPALKKKK
ncbi:sugar ABC transporter substrate-binding protein [Dethiosulfatarculus sandiegensis]|uniref:Sugar ABC transporter substrate-binding protein n=2 Tax=Dethiosulfatarculus sandiegensis TaxID=1429043 RepID=A0A0D2HTE5_9BACT|nr:sugar ABC transporter substrate-binding protein [Dethiosulfatarculus sandiegensis]